MIPSCFMIEERRKNIGQENLFGSVEITRGAVKTLRHHAEVGIFRAENMAHLPQHFIYADVGPSVPGAVVTCKEKPQFFARLPAGAAAEHPFQTREFDERADPHHEKKIGHAPILPDALFAALSAGQGLAG